MPKTREQYNAYMRVYNKARYHRLRNELISQLGGKCSICGSTDNLELDHIDHTTKSIDIGKHILHGYLTVASEVDKLQVLCKKCHATKTLVDLNHIPTKNRNVHGTLSSVRYCRCTICKLTKTIYNRYRRVVPYTLVKDLFPTA